MDIRRRNVLIACILSGAFSATFLLTGFLAALFLVPLEALAVRFGWKSLAVSAAIVAAIMAVDAAVGMKAWNGNTPVVFLVEVGVPLIFMALLAVLHLPGMQRVMAPVRLLVVAGAATLLTVPVLVYVGSDASVMEGLKKQVQTVVTALIPPGASESFEQSVFRAQFTPDAIMSEVSSVYLKTFSFGYYVLFSLTWWFGRRFGTVRIPGQDRPAGLKTFQLPPQAIWAFIAPWAVVAVTLIQPLGTIPEAIAWNAGLIIAFLYALQGVGIIQCLFVRFGISPGLKFTIVFMLVILAITPVADIVVAISLIGLGVSELWVRYRIFTKGAD